MSSFYSVSLIPKYTGYNKYVNPTDEITNLVTGKKQPKLDIEIQTVDMLRLLSDLANRDTKEVKEEKEEIIKEEISDIIDYVIDGDLIKGDLIKGDINKEDIVEKISNEINNKEEYVEELKKTYDQNELMDLLNFNYGCNNEKTVIEKIKDKYGYDVIDNNSECYMMEVDGIKICGRIDGYIIINDVKYLVEIKSRKNRIFKQMPIYEKVQILLYTKLCKCNKVIYIQNYGDELDLKFFENFVYENLYEEVIRRLKRVHECIKENKINEIVF